MKTHTSKNSFFRSQARARLLAMAVAGCFANAGYALPVGPQIAAGTASFNQTANALTINNSNNAILNWQTFSIAANESVRFNQAAASSSVLNRVLANDPSILLGQLTSNGRVWLVNPAGILVGAGARIDTASFVASTLNVRNEDFLAGRLAFQNTPGAGNVVNQGSITTPDGGSVYLIAQNVSNEGVITTPQGQTILAAGQGVQLIDTATPGVKVEITGAPGNVTNLGQVIADAGQIGMVGALVRNSGSLNASSVVSEGGRVFLKASQDAYVDKDGRIVTTGTKGGSIEVLGNRVAVMDNAQLDASGQNGGGSVLVGGDAHGANPAVQNAGITYFGPNASIKADAVGNGDGGKAIVWADDTTRAYGTISARGGQQSGDGGFVETSGKRWLDANGVLVDASAAHGRSGTWLLDPTDITITAGGSDVGIGGAPGFTPGAGSATLSDTTINNTLGGGTSVTVSTTSAYGGLGDITVNGGANISPSYYGGLAFSLEANRNINLKGTINSNTPLDVYMTAGYGGAVSGNIAINNSINTYGGSIYISTNGGVALNSGAHISAANIDIFGNGNFTNLAGPGVLTATNRWYVHSNNPLSDNFGGLMSGNHAGWGNSEFCGSGNCFIFNISPQVIVSSTSLRKTYGTDATTAVDGAYTVTGLNAGYTGTAFILDTLSVVYGGSIATVTSAGSPVSATVAGGPYSIDVAAGTGTVTLPFGYRPIAYSSSGLLTVDPARLTINGLIANNKVYDGTTVATTNSSAATLSGIIGGDVVGLGTVSASFADKNVGDAKPVTVSSASLTGSAAGNYVFGGAPSALSANITVRPLSTWTGGGGDNLWSNPANWDALPDRSNVLAVSLPTGTGQIVVYDASLGSTYLQSLISGQTLAISGGNLNVASNLTTTGYQQSGGALGVGGNFSVTNYFSQTGGNITLSPTSLATINQASGNLVVNALSGGSFGASSNGADITLNNGSILSIADIHAGAGNVTLNNAGALTESGSIFANGLNVITQGGMTLKGANQISNFTASNSGSGDIALTNTGVLGISGISNSVGSISVDNTGALTTTGAISAPHGAISLVAHSPLTIGSGGVSAGGNILLTAGNTSAANDNLTINGDVVTSGPFSITLTAGDALLQNAHVVSNGGSVRATTQTGDIFMALDSYTSTGSMFYDARGNVILATINAGSGNTIHLTAGGDVNAVPGGTGPNLIGGKAILNIGGNANFRTAVQSLDATIGGRFSIVDTLTGTVFTNPPEDLGSDQLVADINSRTHQFDHPNFNPLDLTSGFGYGHFQGQGIGGHEGDFGDSSSDSDDKKNHHGGNNGDSNDSTNEGHSGHSGLPSCS